MAILPNETILQIVKSLIPSSPPVAFAASHPVTQTLISFTLVSTLTSVDARRLLLKHCLYIDSEERLEKLLSLKRQSLIDLTTAAPNGLFLAPFPPSTEESYVRLDQHPNIIKNVALLLSDVREKLTRLVIDMPLRSLYPEDDSDHLRPILREAFAGLTALEEFCSTRDELYLDTKELRGSEPEVWSLWPQLRRLALYNPSLTNAEVWSGFKNCGSLTHLVVTRSDGLYEQVSDDPTLCNSLTQLRRVVVVNTEEEFAREIRRENPVMKNTFLGRLSSFQLSHNAALAHAEEFEDSPFCSAIYVPSNSDTSDMDIDVCQEFVRHHAIEGTLWDLVGVSFLN
ncbi:hypothetical protein FQN57_002849 [Myotisia sp. PD_48]|nr:hypothetical protein FQN57_002849 [Myotisia sp. PD_48]